MIETTGDEPVVVHLQSITSKGVSNVVDEYK